MSDYQSEQFYPATVSAKLPQLYPPEVRELEDDSLTSPTTTCVNLVGIGATKAIDIPQNRQFLARTRLRLEVPSQNSIPSRSPPAANSLHRSQPRIASEPTLEEVDQHANNIHAEKILPCFEIEHVYQITPTEVANINNDRAQINSNKEFLSIFGPKFEQHTWIFTDGSLDKNQGNVGLGVFIPSINHKFSARLPQLTQICTAEVIAINKAITICLERNLDKSVIFSDSKSALQKISSTEINKDRDHISLKTKIMLLKAEANGCEIKLAWIPGHSNIHGNLVADTLANIGRNSENQVEVELDKNDVLPTIKQQIQAKWKQEWKLSTNSRGFSYAQIIKEFPSSPWFTLFPYKDRRHLTTIIRMRTGHCLTNKHLHRIGILTHPYCECGQKKPLSPSLFNLGASLQSEATFRCVLRLGCCPRARKVYPVLCCLLTPFALPLKI
ncbi:uncharacterized protein LOC111692092 [Anoplophora glabripennis]|uniref:uncharacterized protein LOC111692092 n=1 Tax=Anoplophora glabripennis TaxID=217634 RepID=UPI000C78B859|nr:uncharacterized protein LOC111692092 [Anoplophora glabripennis]